MGILCGHEITLILNFGKSVLNAHGLIFSYRKHF